MRVHNRVEVGEGALRDIDRERRHSVATFGSVHAKAHFARLINALQSLESMPNRGRPLRTLGQNWRTLEVDGLWAAYHVTSKDRVVTIAGIIGRDRCHKLARIVRTRRPFTR